MKRDDNDMQPQVERTSSVRGHEPDATSVRAVSWFLAALLVSLVAIGVSLVFLFDVFAYRAERADAPPSPFFGTHSPPPPPHLLANEAEAWRQLDADQRRELSTYGWIDRDADVVRLPIERAMELYVQRWAASEESGP